MLGVGFSYGNEGVFIGEHGSLWMVMDGHDQLKETQI
jgi:hypothetical protein